MAEISRFPKSIVCESCGAPTLMFEESFKKNRPVWCKVCAGEAFARRPSFVSPRVAQKWWDGVDPARRYWKQCFVICGKYVFVHPSATLIHGRIKLTPDGPAFIDHAWVRLADTSYGRSVVFDGVYQQFMYEDEYMAKMGAEMDAEYSAGDARLIALRERTWGPWHKARS